MIRAAREARFFASAVPARSRRFGGCVNCISEARALRWRTWIAGRHHCRESLKVKPPRMALPRAEPCPMASREISNGRLKPTIDARRS